MNIRFWHIMILIVGTALSLLIPTVAATREAQIIFLHARIYQPPRNDGSHIDCLKLRLGMKPAPGIACESHSYAEAMAVFGGKIIAVGKEKSVLKYKRRHTQIVDLRGRFVLPGFNDAHIHLASGGFEKLNVDLVGAGSLSEMQERIAASAKTAVEGEWIIGRGWDHTKWEIERLPTRQDMDAVTEGHPAIFTRVDGHIAVANTAALAAAGINQTTPDPSGGKIDRDAAGESTGILRESARDPVDLVIPPRSPAQRRKAIELALAEAARWGLTSAQDNSDWKDFLVYEDLEREGRLTLRITEWLAFDDSLEALESKRKHHPASDPMLHTGMLKGFMDGSLGSRTAALLEPYSDDPTNSGLPQFDPLTLNHLVTDRLAAGFQIGFHAIGDRGVQLALDAFEESMHNVTERDPQKTLSDIRLRIEHAQVTTPEQIERFAKLRVIASMQPNHLLTDMNWAKERIGAGRAENSYAWRSFLDNGGRLAFGTDYPVEPITPFRGLYAAVTRKNEPGTREYFPAQKVSIEEAIAAYTSGAAYAEFAEKTKGELLLGEWADFVVLDRDITQVPPVEILGTRVLRTVVAGKTVFASGKSASVKQR